MVVIIHGEQTVTSRNYLQSLKQEVDSPVVFNGKNLTLTDLVQSIEGGGLFNEEKHLFVEDFFTRTPSTETDEIFNYLQKQSDCNLVFWEGKEISKKILSQLKNAQIKLFNPPKDVFRFLDSLRPNNPAVILLFHNVLKTEDSGYIFFMLIRQFRLLLALSSLSKNPENTIDEVKRLAPWQIGKLKKQASFFGIEQLKKIYSNLFNIDLAQKTGTTPLALTQAIDFFLLDL